VGLFAALAVIVCGQAIAVQPAPGAPQAPLASPAARPDEVTLTADTLRYQTDTQQIVADGHVELRGQGVTVRSEHMTYDVRARKVTAVHAQLIRGETVGVADQIALDLATDDATLDGGLFLQKQGVTVDQLLGAHSAEELLGAGKNQLALRGARIQRVSEHELAVEHLSFTPCDCNPAKPSWRIDARRANVKPGDSVFLSWPVIYVHSVPVFVFPALDLPLKDRRTGFLIPRPSVSTNSGLHLEQPFFVTLGDSYDLTFTPGYYFGATKVRGIQGPHLDTDFRYAPVAGTRGEFALTLIEDLKAGRHPENIDAPIDGSSRRGLRWSLAGTHTQELGGGFADRVDLALASDGFLSSDMTTDLLSQQARYLRSDATVFQRQDDRYLGIALGFRQDVRFGFDLFQTDSTKGGLAGPRTLQQLPDAVAAWPERRLFGNWLGGDWLGGLTLLFTRLAPLVGSYGDEGTGGVYTLSPAPDTGEGDRVYQPGERVARDRLDLNPTLSTSWRVGNLLSLTPTFALRQDLYAAEQGQATAQRGHVWADLRADSRLARTYGGPGGVTHAIEPSIELRYAPPGWGEALGPAQGALIAGLRPYDAVDLSMPDEGITQVVAQVSQALLQRQGLATRELLRLDLGEELDLRAAHPPRDAFARLGTDLWGIHLLGLARYDVLGRRFSQLTASASVRLFDRVSLYGVYNNLLLGGSALQRRAIDTLVGTDYSGIPKVAAGAPDRAQVLNLGGSLDLLGGLGLGYDAIVQPSAVQALAQQVFGLSYAPACRCWKVEIQAKFTRGPANDPFEVFSFGGGLTIEGFGSIGSGG
jgi:LPS-assembly protein